VDEGDDTSGIMIFDSAVGNEVSQTREEIGTGRCVREWL
jgi:hypothetical protein